MKPHERLEARLRAAREQGRTALLPYLMAGFPEREAFGALLARVAARADVVELGLAFSDPTADGPVIASAGRVAIENGAHFSWVCALAAKHTRDSGAKAGLVLMSYLNPLLAVGLAEAVGTLVASGFEGLIVPDLPLEESDELRALTDEHGLALIQLVTPLTPRARARRLAAASRGFLYAVTRAGTTGAPADPRVIESYLRALRAESELPLCAGFGVRDAAQVRAFAGLADGVVVGSALIDLLARGKDPVPLLDSLVAAAAAGVSP